ncbi:hypothetical protein [Streptomyces sp. NPDC017988]|uniref:hypothetical protein n=1 Tax=Streptomyces sp. NPDC017988 TaxID=3365025 RepID=UPI0037A124A5
MLPSAAAPAPAAGSTARSSTRSRRRSAITSYAATRQRGEVDAAYDGANTALRKGVADAVSFARHFVANPDLVSRFALGRELAAGDPATYYEGGARGYADYPAAG